MRVRTVRIEGLKELDRALADLPKSTAKRVTRGILLEAGEPLAQEARVREPKLDMHLYENTDVGTKLTRRQAGLHKSGGNKDFAEAFVGTSDPAGVQQEFGNEHNAAQPFLRPAWDAKQDQVLFIISHRLWVAIETAAARLARRLVRRNG